MYRLTYLMWCAIALLSYTCASMASLPGGPKDETAPSVVEEKTTANFQTNFNVDEIVITLDEWIKLDDPINRVLISPPLEKRADIRLKGRSVVVSFDEEETLRENATYTINFGESILDITEGNALKNYAFVFSTGPFLDSLSFRGQVIDGYTAEPIEEATILVYQNMEDSIVFKEKPFYATRSEKDGTFEINNMKSGYFKVVAIKDENLNYLYDPASESIGFVNDSLLIDGDTSQVIQILMSDEEPRPVIDRRDTSKWNTAEFTFNRIPYEIEVDYNDPDATLFFDRKEKQIIVWSIPERSNWQLYFKDTLTSQVDTFNLRRNTNNALADPLERLTRLVPTGHPSDPFYFCFNRPILAIDTNYMLTFLPDSSQGKLPQMRIVDSLPQCIAFETKWTPDSVYRIIMLPGSLTDIFEKNNDTLELTLPIGNIERFGNIQLRVEGLDTNRQYLIELVLKEKAQRSVILDGANGYSGTFTKLKPGSYQLRITEDANENGRWDPAKYLEQIQPERIISTDIEQLRANWDVEVNYKWVQQ